MQEEEQKYYNEYKGAQRKGADSTTVTRIKKEMQYTHMGWNNKAVALLPNGWVMEFPAFLSHKAAVDNDIIDMMRSIMNKSYRCEARSDLLLELHAKHHHKWAIRYNYDLSIARMNPLVKSKINVTGNMFSSCITAQS